MNGLSSTLQAFAEQVFRVGSWRGELPPTTSFSPEGARAMNPPDEFLKHAADCEQMAKFARDAESKATWNRMAERWRRCAEKFTTESLAAHHAMMAKRRQGVAPDLAHH